MSEQDDQQSQVTTEDADNTQNDDQQNDQQYNDEKLQNAFYGKSDDSSDDNDEDSKDQDDDKSTDDQGADDSQDDGEDDKDDTADDEKDGDDKKGDDEIALEKPKESRLSDADMERIAQFAKEQGLSKEAAQKLVDDENSAMGAFLETLQNEHRQATEQWREDVKSDKEIGGDNYKRSVEYAKRAVKKYGTDKLMEDLDSTGYGNHPEVVRVFARIGKAMEEADEVKSGQNSRGEKSVAEQFYPSNVNQ